MMNQNRCWMVLAMCTVALSLAVPALAEGQAVSGAVHEITITASSYQFDPAVITVKKGDKVRLIVTATDRRHGINIDGYDIDQTLKPGEPTTIEFTADKAGTFEFKCSVYCGMGHQKMKGKLIVEE
jgi:cytochrome c oxidase subunit 2